MSDECVARPRRRYRGCSHLWPVEPVHDFNSRGGAQGDNDIDWGLDPNDDGVADHNHHNDATGHDDDGAADNGADDDPTAHHPSRWLSQRSGGSVADDRNLRDRW